MSSLGKAHCVDRQLQLSELLPYGTRLLYHTARLMTSVLSNKKYAPKTYFSVRVFLLRAKLTILKKMPTLSGNYVQSVRVRTLAVNKSRYTKPNTILKLKRIIKTEKCASCVSLSYIPPICNKNISIFIFFN